jgi:hypothetical protein
MNTKLFLQIEIGSLLLLTLMTQTSLAQGTFRNLDLEMAILPVSPLGELGGIVSVGDAIPSWRAYQGLTPGEVVNVFHNGFSLGGPATFIHGPQSESSLILAGRSHWSCMPALAWLQSAKLEQFHQIPNPCAFTVLLKQLSGLPSPVKRFLPSASIGRMVMTFTEAMFPHSLDNLASSALLQLVTRSGEF